MAFSRAAAIGRPVKISAAKSSKLNSPVYASALGLADLIFDSIEGEAEPEENLGSRIRNMFSRS